MNLWPLSWSPAPLPQTISGLLFMGTNYGFKLVPVPLALPELFLHQISNYISVHNFSSKLSSTLLLPSWPFCPLSFNTVVSRWICLSFDFLCFTRIWGGRPWLCSRLYPWDSQTRVEFNKYLVVLCEPFIYWDIDITTAFISFSPLYLLPETPFCPHILSLKFMIYQESAEDQFSLPQQLFVNYL